jgi:hypothetical protein
MKINLNQIKKTIRPILKKEGVKRAGLFGSYVRGEQKKDSDIDILVEVSSNYSLLDLIGLKLEIERILKKRVDLIEYCSIHPLIKKQALKEEIRII